MNESPNKSAVVVGLFVFIGIAFLVVGVLMIGDLHETFKKKIQIAALFEDVNGLQTGNNVWFSGVKIGTVSNLRFYGKSQVAVNLKIDIKVQQYIRKNAKIKIGTDGLIGNKILVIYGGTEMSEAVKEGDTLQVEKTFSSEDMINMLQENNQNLLAITGDFKTLGKNLVDGKGTLGKLLNDNAVYDNIDATTLVLQSAAAKAQLLLHSLNDFSAGLHKKGTLANELVTDTVVFNSFKTSVLELGQMADTAQLLVSALKKASTNPRSALGVLLQDETTGAHLKETMRNLELSSKKLDEDLEAVQHNFLLRRFFKKKAKAAQKTSIEQ